MFVLKIKKAFMKLKESYNTTHYLVKQELFVHNGNKTKKCIKK